MLDVRDATDTRAMRMAQVIGELKNIISSRYPGTAYVLEYGEDGKRIFLIPMVDLDDPEPVLDLVIDRLLDLQVEEGLPIHVAPETRRRE